MLHAVRVVPVLRFVGSEASTLCALLSVSISVTDMFVLCTDFRLSDS